jgi:hypothetical protein
LRIEKALPVGATPLKRVALEGIRSAVDAVAAGWRSARRLSAQAPFPEHGRLRFRDEQNQHSPRRSSIRTVA